MRTSVALAPGERGQTLTLAFECYHGRLEVTANGVALTDIGDSAIGEHRYVIAPAAADTLELVAAGRADRRSVMMGFNGPARLVVGARTEPSAIATLTRQQMVVSAMLSGALCFLFLLQYALDRRRRQDLAYAVQSFCALSVPFYTLDIASVPLVGFMNCLLWPAAIYCIHYEFELDRPPRWLVGGFLVLAAAALGSTWSYPLGRITLTAHGLLVLATYVHLIRQLLRLTTRRFDARFLAIALASSFAMNLFALLNQVELHVFEDLHIYSSGGALLLLAQLLILARSHVKTFRDRERVAHELQREVAARSKELAEALTKLANED